MQCSDVMDGASAECALFAASERSIAQMLFSYMGGCSKIFLILRLL